MKHSSSSQFADDTCLLYAQNKMKSLETIFKLSLKHSSSSHFADDTCLLYAQSKIKSLETNSNFHWRK